MSEFAEQITRMINEDLRRPVNVLIQHPETFELLIWELLIKKAVPEAKVQSSPALDYSLMLLQKGNVDVAIALQPTTSLSESARLVKSFLLAGPGTKVVVALDVPDQFISAKCIRAGAYHCLSASYLSQPAILERVVRGLDH